MLLIAGKPVIKRYLEKNGINTDAAQRSYMAYFNCPAYRVGSRYRESKLPGMGTATSNLTFTPTTGVDNIIELEK